MGGKIVEKEEQIIRLLSDISKWYHKWAEVRDGKTVICIEYERVYDPEHAANVAGEGAVE